MLILQSLCFVHHSVSGKYTRLDNELEHSDCIAGKVEDC